MFRLLKQYKHTGDLWVQIDDLRERLGYTQKLAELVK